jgi:hypothetical protein
MPSALHTELARRSDAAGVSLNQFIVAALSRAASGETATNEPRIARPMPPALRRALVANAVVVTVAAATAIALIVIAWL